MDFDWLLAHLIGWWVYVYDDPVRLITLIVTLMVLVWTVGFTIHVRRAMKRDRLRGSRMTKKEREKWRRKHVADLVTSALEDAQDRGELTDAEVSRSYRQLATVFKLPDLRRLKMLGVAEVARPSKDKLPNGTHLHIVKNGIIQRTNSVFRRLLYTPVAIPGPPPGAEVKTKPIRKRGALLSRIRTA